MIIRKTLFVFIVLLIPLTAISGPAADRYLYGSMGAGYGHIKDTGTSPLRYHGLFSDATMAYVQRNADHVLRLSGDGTFLLGINSGRYSLFNLSGNFSISYLKSLPVVLRHNMRWRLGGTFYAGMSGILNESYQNASLNLDFLTDLMLSTAFEYDLSLPEKDMNIMFIHCHLPSRTYRAFFELDLPLLILNGRPEFPYVNDEDTDFLSRHYYLGGFYMKTRIGLTRILTNGNAIEAAYEWDMYSSGKRDIYLLERASHSLQLAFYFKLN